jgi:DNA end-binding protein Ku
VMHYASELVEPDEFKFPGEVEVRPQEMKMAVQLIENLTEGWKPEQYKDEYAETLEEIIAQKAKTGKITVPQFDKAPEGAQVTSLMEALERSLAGGKKGGSGEDAPPKKRASTAKKASKKKAA